MANPLEVAEGLQYQTKDERLAHQITTTNWVSDPTSPTVVVYDENDGKDVTTTVYPSYPDTPLNATNDLITLPLLRELTTEHTYRIEVKFSVNSSVYECYFKVKCER